MPKTFNPVPPRMVDGKPVCRSINQFSLVWDVDPPALREWQIDRNNPNCPLNRFIGNENAVKRMARAAYIALGNEFHDASDLSFALLGPASTGKTTLAKLFAATLDLPFVEIHPEATRYLDDVINKFTAVLANTFFEGDDGLTYSLELVPAKDETQESRMGEKNYFKLPPCVIFVDEVHQINNTLQDALLKATEKKDGILEFKPPVSRVEDSSVFFNCRSVCWIIATTDRGKLLKPFDTRFTKVYLESYTKEEVGKIVRLNYPQWNEETCKLVAKYGGRIPREALSFAKEVAMAQTMNPGTNLKEIVDTVAQEAGIDPFGMTEKQVNLLTLLGQRGPIAMNRLCDNLGVEQAELENYILPALTLMTKEQQPIVTVTSRGYSITETGLEELRIRKINNLGKKALASNDE